MTTVPTIPDALTGIAKLLGHDACPSADERPTTVREWWEASMRAISARAEEVKRLRDEGVAEAAPGAVWHWDWSLNRNNGGVVYVSGKRRLRITATEKRLTLRVEAGPDWKAYEPAGAFVRRGDGGYEWKEAQQQQFHDHPPLYDPGDYVPIVYQPAVEGSWIAVAAIPRPGRAIIVAGIDDEAFVYWINPKLVDGRPDRLYHLLSIDRAVFGGALSEADSTGRLARLAENAFGRRNR